MSAPASVDMCPDFVVVMLEGLQTLSDLAGMTAASIGLVASVVMWLKLEIGLIRSPSTKTRCEGLHQIRGWLGRYILLGLEFMVVSDVIHSFLSPDINSLLKLALIVVIRTAISFFLGRELEQDSS